MILASHAHAVTRARVFDLKGAAAMQVRLDKYGDNPERGERHTGSMAPLTKRPRRGGRKIWNSIKR